MITQFALVYIAVVLLVSLITFVLYGWDKRQAKNDGWRVPEFRLHLLAFLGGWPGAMIGQNYFRHKTQKLGFKVMTWVAALFHLIGFGFAVYSMM